VKPLLELGGAEDAALLAGGDANEAVPSRGSNVEILLTEGFYVFAPLHARVRAEKNAKPSNPQPMRSPFLVVRGDDPKFFISLPPHPIPLRTLLRAGSLIAL
jgi:hypothetical protein